MEIFIVREPANVGLGFDARNLDYGTHGYAEVSIYLWWHTLHISIKTKGRVAHA